MIQIMRRHAIFMIERLTIVKMLTLPKAIYRCSTIPIRLRKCLSISNVLRVFIIEGFGILSHSFIMSIDNIIQYLFLACWYVKLHWFLNIEALNYLEKIVYSGLFFVYIIILNLLIFCWLFLHFSSWEIFTLSFPYF